MRMGTIALRCVSDHNRSGARSITLQGQACYRDAEGTLIVLSFSACAIPHGSLITGASLIVTAAQNDERPTAFVIRGGILSPPATYPACCYVAASQVVWHLPMPWTAGSSYLAPELDAIIQEIVSAPQWKPEYTLLLELGGDHSARQIVEYEQDLFNAARLRICFAPPENGSLAIASC